MTLRDEFRVATLFGDVQSAIHAFRERYREEILTIRRPDISHVCVVSSHSGE